MGICLGKSGEEHDGGEDPIPLQNQAVDELEKEEAKPIDIEDDDGDIQNLGNGDGGTGGPQVKQATGKVTLLDFEFIKVLGRGSFGKVMLVQFKGNQKLYAMKILRKDMIEKRNQIIHTKHEREIMENVKHPFIVQLHFAFQTKFKLYLIMDFLIGGELFFHLRRAFRFNEERSKFYAAELILALEYLHQKGVVYRDLKPENILIGQDGHLKLTDFGLSKTNLKEGEKTNTFCGTPEYLAPEILLGQGHDHCVDWWSLGALLYEMLSGAPPFYSKDKTQMFRNRLEKPIEIKQWFSEDAVNILQQLLQNNPNTRLGFNGAQEIKSHRFFNEVDWNLVGRKQIEPPFKPKVFNTKDLRHFDVVINYITLPFLKMFTDEPVQDTPIAGFNQKADTYDKFTYIKNLDQSVINNPSLVKYQQQQDKFIDVNENFTLIKK